MKYKVLGGHVHCRVFAARQLNTTFAKCGDLTFRVEEFEDFQIACPGLLWEEEDAGYEG